MHLKIFQVFKPESSNLKEIQDRYSISKENAIVALSDGTTQGYRSEEWAQYLVNEFIKNPSFTNKTFKKFIDNISDIEVKNKSPNTIKNPSIAWLDKQKKEEGASATLIAIKLYEKTKKYKMIAYGDCKIFIIRNGKLFCSFPKIVNTSFINSKNKVIDEASIFTDEGDFVENDRFIIATDAIADFISNYFKNEIENILELKSFKSFMNLVEESFLNRSLEMDDITLIDVDPFKKNNIEIFCPTNKFIYDPKLKPKNTKGFSIAKNGDNIKMEKIIKALKSEKYKLNGDVRDLKEITSTLIVFNVINLILVFILILYITFPKVSNLLNKGFEKSKHIFKIKNKELVLDEKSIIIETEINSNDSNNIDKEKILDE
jgi:serine/threonine protein phosphatase PrpC